MNAEENDAGRKRHPIQVVVRRTGLSADRLRAWEKRYGVVEPGRSRGDRRLYSDDDIEHLRLLHRAIRGGRRIGRVADLSREELRALVREDQREEARSLAEPEAEAEAQLRGYLEAAIAAVGRLEAGALQATLKRAAVTLEATTVIERLVAPLLERVGELWSAGEIRPAHEHLASAVLRGVLLDLVEEAQSAESAPLLIAVTLPGQRHEFGALLVALQAATHGWRVVYLGPDLPAGDVAAAARQASANAVAVSLVYPEADAGMATELRRLRAELPADLPILVGGRATSSYRDVLEEIGALQPGGIERLPGALSGLTRESSGVERGGRPSLPASLT